jgi:hypothetical protein
MAALDRENCQWTFDVSIYHRSDLGHILRGAVLDRRGGWHVVGTWTWKGLGVPAELVSDIQARVSAVVAEHLVTRYGIANQLPLRWAGEPEIT